MSRNLAQEWAYLKSIATDRWFTPEEAVTVLINFKCLQPYITVSLQPIRFPNNGAIYIYDRLLTCNFKLDGVNWSKKKNQNRIQETYDTFYVQGYEIQRVNCRSTDGILQRRIYRIMKFNGWPYCLVQYRVISGSSVKRQKLTSTSIPIAPSPNALQVGMQSLSSSSKTTGVSDRLDGEFYDGNHHAQFVKVDPSRMPNSEVFSKTLRGDVRSTIEEVESVENEDLPTENNALSSVMPVLNVEEANHIFLSPLPLPQQVAEKVVLSAKAKNANSERVSVFPPQVTMDSATVSHASARTLLTRTSRTSVATAPFPRVVDGFVSSVAEMNECANLPLLDPININIIAQNVENVVQAIPQISPKYFSSSLTNNNHNSNGLTLLAAATNCLSIRPSQRDSILKVTYNSATETDTECDAQDDIVVTSAKLSPEPILFSLDSTVPNPQTGESSVNSHQRAETRTEPKRFKAPKPMSNRISQVQTMSRQNLGTVSASKIRRTLKDKAIDARGVSFHSNVNTNLNSQIPDLSKYQNPSLLLLSQASHSVSCITGSQTIPSLPSDDTRFMDRPKVDSESRGPSDSQSVTKSTMNPGSTGYSFTNASNITNTSHLQSHVSDNANLSAPSYVRLASRFCRNYNLENSETFSSKTRQLQDITIIDYAPSNSYRDTREKVLICLNGFLEDGIDIVILFGGIIVSGECVSGSLPVIRCYSPLMTDSGSVYISLFCRKTGATSRRSTSPFTFYNPPYSEAPVSMTVPGLQIRFAYDRLVPELGPTSNRIDDLLLTESDASRNLTYAIEHQPSFIESVSASKLLKDIYRTNMSATLNPYPEGKLDLYSPSHLNGGDRLMDHQNKIGVLMMDRDSITAAPSLNEWWQ